jgi:hypothetical protein
MRSVVRVLVAIVCLLLLVGGGWLAVALAQAAHLQRQVVRLEEEVRRQEELRRTMADRLGRTRRLGSLHVIQQHRSGDPAATPLSPASAGELADSEIITTVEFIELDDRGRQVGSRRAQLPGRVVFLDAWTVRFPQDRVIEDDPMRGRTVALLRRIYSDRMPPAQGVPIDTPGSVPDGYAASDGARFEQALWKRFWRLATDPQAAEAMGVRVAQGEAVYKPTVPGQRFDVELESSGGLTLRPAP